MKQKIFFLIVLISLNLSAELELKPPTLPEPPKAPKITAPKITAPTAPAIPKELKGEEAKRVSEQMMMNLQTQSKLKEQDAYQKKNEGKRDLERQIQDLDKESATVGKLSSKKAKDLKKKKEALVKQKDQMGKEIKEQEKNLNKK